MEKPKVSIIVPIYNVEKYLDRCMKSLINQTLKEIEIILVDDESPDNCPAICDQYALQDARIKVIHKKNEGLGFARNSGLEIATGEYVAFVDSDDYVDISMYEIVHKYAVSQSYDVVFCGFYKQFLLGGIFHEERKSLQELYFAEDKLKSLTLDFVASDINDKNDSKYDMSVWHSVYSRKIIEEDNIRFISEREYASEDIPFQLDFLSKATKVLMIPDCLYFYCYNQNSLTKKYSSERFRKVIQLYYLLKEKTQLLHTGNERSIRLFWSNSRVCLRSVIASDLSKKEKRKEITEIVNNPIWNEINSELLRIDGVFYQKILLNLLLTKRIRLLYYFLILYNKYGKGYK